MGKVPNPAPPQDFKSRLAALRAEFPAYDIGPSDLPSTPYRAVKQGGGDKALVLLAGSYDGLRSLLIQQAAADSERVLLELRTRQLATLARRMGVRKYSVDIGDNEITVSVTVGGTPRAVRITCEPRPTADDELWFWTHWGDPLAQANDVMGAEVALVGLLARP